MEGVKVDILRLRTDFVRQKARSSLRDTLPKWEMQHTFRFDNMPHQQSPLARPVQYLQCLQGTLNGCE